MANQTCQVPNMAKAGQALVGDVLTRGKRRRALYGHEHLTMFNESQMEELKPKGKQLQLSQDSSSSSPQSSGSQIRLRNEVSRFTWVQCDNPDCMKWRKVLNTDAEQLDTDAKWFCSMNPDVAHNNCKIKEEDYTEYEKMAAKCKMKFVLSVFPLGELVWAKMPGYCRWPAMISKDPVLDEFVTFGLLGEPESYHVEFLGQEHTHSWTRATSITPYGHRDPQELSGKLKKARPKLRLASDKGCKRKYKSCSVDGAVREAEALLKLGMDERIKCCVYNKVPSAPSTASTAASPRSDLYRFADNLQRQPEKVKPRRGRKPKNNDNQKSNVSPDIKKNTSYHAESMSRQVGPSYALKSSNSARAVAADSGSRSKGSFVVPNIGSGIGSLTNFNIGSMASMSKEEKLTLDIENYRCNEKAFNHDLHRFLQRNDRRLTRLPFWQNTVVNVFTLFQNVVDRGGYHQVCYHSKWNSVYREVAATNNSSGGGVCAKKYYERNLLAYEMFLAKKAFEEYLPPKKLERKSKLRNVEMVNRSIPVPAVVSTSDPELVSDNGISDLEEMLDKLDEGGEQENLCVVSEASPLKRNLLPLCFGDDTPPPKMNTNLVEADVASEFGFAQEPEEAAQTVPVFDGIDSESGSADDALFHEMQVMEQVFEEMDNVSLEWL